MADGVENEAVLSLNDDPGSMSAKLARMAEPPVKEEAQSEADASVQTTAEAEAAATEVVAEAGTEAAEEKATQEAAETTAEADPGAAKPAKYASIEAAERAANEAATRMHTATTETATERKAREVAEEKMAAIQKELDDLKTAQAQKDAEEAAAKALPDLEAKYEDAMAKIAAIKLEQDDAGNTIYPRDYNKQVAKAWASTGANPEEIAARVLERIEAKQAAEKAEVAEQEAATAADRVRADAEKLANSKFGLDMTKGSADYRLFYSHVDDLAADEAHEMRGKPFEEQVKWASEQVRKAIGAKIEMTDAERAAAAKIQQNNTVLERGVTRTVPQEQPKQRSMAQILGQATV